MTLLRGIKHMIEKKISNKKFMTKKKLKLREKFPINFHRKKGTPNRKKKSTTHITL